MAYDEELAFRLEAMLAEEPRLTTKRMFGGLAFLVGGHMAVAASGQGGLLVRVDPARSDELLDPPRVVRMVMRGREMAGWLRVADEAIDEDDALRGWLDEALALTRGLPPK